ncbi:MAG TPA: hypothetical protein VGR95_08280 [Thermoanaerobaculia bacterium]|jgi:hypothetical protein|nr:hypothetical protein [Thermoanaerobaculia bacterium]
MSVTIRCGLVLTIALLGIAAAHAAPCPDIYSCALDARWPKSNPLVSDSGFVRVITIRVIPSQSVDAEEYVVLRVKENGGAAVEYARPNGDSLFQQIRRLSSPTSDPAEISKRLEIRSASFSANREIRKLIAAFSSLSVRAELSSRLYLDATRYDFTEDTPMTQLAMVLYDDSSVPKGSAAVNWMKSVVRACRAAAPSGRNEGTR